MIASQLALGGHQKVERLPLPGVQLVGAQRENYPENSAQKIGEKRGAGKHIERLRRPLFRPAVFSRCAPTYWKSRRG